MTNARRKIGDRGPSARSFLRQQEVGDPSRGDEHRRHGPLSTSVETSEAIENVYMGWEGFKACFGVIG